jgi:hypothetical protein
VPGDALGSDSDSDIDITEFGPVHHWSLPGTLWTTINAAEQMPGVLTPLGFTYWIGPCDRGTKGEFRRLGILRAGEVTLGPTPDERVGGAFFGRWVANVDEFRRLADLTPGVSGAAFEKGVFGSSRPALPARVRRRRYPLAAVIAPATVIRLRWEVPRAAAEIRVWWREFTDHTRGRGAVPLLTEAMARIERGITLQMVARARGRELADAGVIDDAEDVFYLMFEEFLTDPPSDARRRIEHRRRLAEAYARVDVPTLWSGTPTRCTRPRSAPERRRTRSPGSRRRPGSWRASPGFSPTPRRATSWRTTRSWSAASRIPHGRPRSTWRPPS